MKTENQPVKHNKAYTANTIKKYFNKAYHFSLTILFGLFLAFLLNLFAGQMVEVSGCSMEPTYHDGYRIFMEKITYRFFSPKRYDVIVFPRKGDYYLIKRIIGLPNETVYISRTGRIYINGELLDEDYGMEDMTYAGAAGTSIKLGPDEFFVLGDNRNNSLDSRSIYIGNVKADEITGKILW